MQYQRCIISRPGLFENVTIDFSDGVNIITGKNGSGKSVLAKGLIDGIWKNFSGKPLLPDDIWKSLFLDIHFNLDNKSKYQFTSNSDRNFTIRALNGKSNNLIYQGNNNGMGNEESEEEFNNLDDILLRDFINIISLNTFISTSFINSPSDNNNFGIFKYSNIKYIILNDKTDFYSLYRHLNKNFKHDDFENNPILLGIKKHRVSASELEKKIQIIDLQGTRRDKLKKERQIISREINAMNSAQIALRNKIEILRSINENLNKIEEYRLDYERLDAEVKEEQKKIRSASSIRDDLDRLYPQFKNIKKIDSSKLDRLQDIFSDIRNLNEKLDNFHSKRKRNKNILMRLGVSVNIAALTIISAIFYKNNFSIYPDILFLSGIFGFSLIVTLILILISIAITRGERFNRLNDEKNELENQLKVILEESNVELEGYKLSELYEFLLQYFEDYIEYSDRTEDLRSIVRSLKDKNYLKKMTKELSSLKKMDNDTKSEIDKNVKSLDLNLENILEANRLRELIASVENEIKYVENQKELKNSILLKIDEKIDTNVDDKNGKELLVQQLDRVNGILTKLDSYRSSFEFIGGLLDEAIVKREKTQLSIFTEKILENFNFLTKNQYITKIDNNIVRNIIVNNEIPDQLNPTIIHAIYLSSKISITEFLDNENISLPLIFDDPFIFMDDERTDRFKEMISEISSKRQVIIFTHLSDKKDWGTHKEL